MHRELMTNKTLLGFLQTVCSSIQLYLLESHRLSFFTVSKGKDHLASWNRAECGSFRGELDHDKPLREEKSLVKVDLDEPPDGKGEGEPDGDGVYHQCEVGVEEHEDSPRERVLKFKLDSISQKTLSRFCNSQSQC